MVVPTQLQLQAECLLLAAPLPEPCSLHHRSVLFLICGDTYLDFVFS